MPPARVADAEVDFHGASGNAMKHGALFLASLTNDGPLKVGRSHWLASALARYLGEKTAARHGTMDLRLIASGSIRTMYCVA